MPKYHGNKIDPDLTPSNIKSGVEIFGVTGTLAGGGVSNIRSGTKMGTSFYVSESGNSNSRPFSGFAVYEGTNYFRLITVVGADNPNQDAGTGGLVIDKTSGLMTINQYTYASGGGPDHVRLNNWRFDDATGDYYWLHEFAFNSRFRYNYSTNTFFMQAPPAGLATPSSPIYPISCSGKTYDVEFYTYRGPSSASNRQVGIAYILINNDFYSLDGSYTITRSFGSLNDFAKDISFSGDGMRLFVLGLDYSNGGRTFLQQYSLASAYDITSGVTYQDDVKIIYKFPRSFCFHSNGAGVYYINDDNFIIDYALSVPYSLGGTFSITRSNTSVPNLADASSIRINNDGTKMFIADPSQSAVLQYTMSTPYNISTLTYDGLYNTGVSWIDGMDLSDDGTKMYITSGSSLYQYSLSFAYVVTSGVTFDGNYNTLNNSASAAVNIKMGPSGTKLYGVFSDNDDNDKFIAQYSLSSAYEAVPDNAIP